MTPRAPRKPIIEFVFLALLAPWRFKNSFLQVFIMSIRTFLLLFLLPVSLALAAPASDTERVERYFAGLETLEAEFRQQVQDPEQGLMQEASGEVWISRPGRFRWNYLQPYEQELVSDGSNVWTYDRDLEQATVKPAEEVLSDTPAMLLSGGQSVAAVFRIEALAEEGGMDWFRLQPLAQDATVEEIHLGFQGEELRIMQVTDLFGNRTWLEFDQVRRNQAIDAGMFRFMPPDGTDVIGTPE
jgi:outer membrane lipoprotein carrier protein